MHNKIIQMLEKDKDKKHPIVFNTCILLCDCLVENILAVEDKKAAKTIQVIISCHSLLTSFYSFAPLFRDRSFVQVLGLCLPLFIAFFFK